MLLLTKANRKALPPLYSQDGKGDNAIAYVKFFTPDSNWTWYATEFDGEDTFFGWVEGFDKELGYFSLSELLAARGPMGLPIERDMYFKPTRLGDLKEKEAYTVEVQVYAGEWSPRFAFEASNKEDASNKVFGWAQYQGFSYYTDATNAPRSDVRFRPANEHEAKHWLHNEYMRS